MSSPVGSDDSPIYSTVADDPCLGPIVEAFVASIPLRIAELVTLVARHDWVGVQQLAHQIKGAAASYGFPQITFAAALLEQAVRTQEDAETILERFHVIVDLGGRIRSRSFLNVQ